MSLVLSRKDGEAIVLFINGEQIARVEVGHSHTDSGICRTKLAVDAPQNVRVLREEMLDRVNRGLEQARRGELTDGPADG